MADVVRKFARVVPVLKLLANFCANVCKLCCNSRALPIIARFIQRPVLKLLCQCLQTLSLSVRRFAFCANFCKVQLPVLQFAICAIN
jgi:hypothetical protein